MLSHARLHAMERPLAFIGFCGFSITKGVTVKYVNLLLLGLQ